MAKKRTRDNEADDAGQEARNTGTLQRVLDQLASCHPSIRKWLLAEGYLPAELAPEWSVADRHAALEMALGELDLLGKARRFSAMTGEEVGALDEGGLWFCALLPMPSGLRPSLRLLLEYRLEFDIDTWVRMRWEDWDDGLELSGRARRLIGTWGRKARERENPNPGGEDHLYDRDGRRRDPADWWKPE